MPTDLEQAQELQKRLQVAIDALGQPGDFATPMVEFKRYIAQKKLRKEITDVDSMIERWRNKSDQS